MAKFYGLKDYLRENGLKMSQFKNLDIETQKKLRAKHQKKLKKLIYEKHLFEDIFLSSKNVKVDIFSQLTASEKEELKKEFTTWKRDWYKEQKKLKKEEAEREAEYRDYMELLMCIGVPFSPDGTPLGIGWD